MSEEKKHAILSASGSEIWLNCPGSVALIAIAPEPPENKYAVEGTKGHTLLDIWANNQHFTPKDFLKLGYSMEMIQAVKVCIDDLKKVWQPTSKKELKVETKVSLERIVAPGMFGTVDLAVIEHFGTLEVTDYKHGRGVKVEVVKEGIGGVKYLNTQLVYYALGLADLFDFNFKEVILKIVQPRCAQGTAISSIKVSIKELMGYIELFRKGVDRTLQKNAKRFAGPHCRFCKAKPICKEGQGKFRTNSREDFL